VAADILGLDYSEIRTNVSVKGNFIRAGRKYVCISEHSTMCAKLWNYPGGWQEIVDYLNDIGYDVISVSREATALTKVVPINNRPIEEIADIIKIVNFYWCGFRTFLVSLGT